MNRDFEILVENAIVEIAEKVREYSESIEQNSMGKGGGGHKWRKVYAEFRGRYAYGTRTDEEVEWALCYMIIKLGVLKRWQDRDKNG